MNTAGKCKKADCYMFRRKGAGSTIIHAILFLMFLAPGFLSVLFLYGCGFFGAFDNPVDPGGTNWQGFFTVEVKDMAVGCEHVLMVTDDGTVYSWGRDYTGQLGRSVDEPAGYEPGTVPALDGVTIEGVASGCDHSLAWNADGNLWGWGSNGSSKLGTAADGSVLPDDEYDKPVLIYEGAIMADGGRNFTAVIDTSGEVYAWGAILTDFSDSGSAVFESAVPEHLDIPGDRAAVKIVCTAWSALAALADDGTVWQWGYLNDDTFHETFDQVAGIEAVDIAGGGGHFLAELSDGSLYTWGGFYDHSWDGTYPADSGYASIAAGYSCSLVLTDDGKLYGWGANGAGQLGLPYWMFSTSEPVRIDTLYDADFTGARIFSDGHSNTFVSLADGSLYAWGENDSGMLGIGSVGAPDTSLERFVVDFGDESVQIAEADGGGGFGLARDYDGNIWSWGGNDSGLLGLGDTDYRQYPEMITSVAGFDGLAAGSNFAVARVDDGTLYAWGDGDAGQLGDGAMTDSSAPVQVSGLTDVAGFDCGDEFTLARCTDGALYAWGDNQWGQLGLGHTTDTGTPTEVTGFDAPLTAVSCFGGNSMALDEEGNVYTWGGNDSGQIGDGTTDSRTSTYKLPSSLFAGRAVVSIEAGMLCSFAVTDDGRLWGWGSAGELGFDQEDVDSIDSSHPMEFLDVGAVAGITSAGQGIHGGHALIIRTEAGQIYYCGISPNLMSYADTEGLQDPDYRLSDLWNTIGITGMEGGTGGNFFLRDGDGVLYAF